MISHAAAARAHARIRFKERFGAWMTKGVYSELCAEIAAGVPPMIGQGRDGAEVYRIKVYAAEAYAVWCPHLQRIVTFTQTVPACLRKETA